ncbi:hypothetical protein [Nodosilinea sp. E11]|uniref:hypothetical protein n=1 Tax=Nodosilinea sp. E11 TaxID=3037479 RepID=UPI0029350D3F|nr:hypothetical protein [Nodosilinea sp. E11]WOD38879.1 hypothetical protein RRF56_21985 [Nodosilinea sp. E11]
MTTTQQSTMSNAPGPLTDRVLPAAGSQAAVAEGLSADPWAKALFAFGHQIETTPHPCRPQRPPSAHDTNPSPISETAPVAYSFADAAPQLANPMEPLRDRDRAALQDFFAHDQMVTIEADILHRLSYLMPEPAWEVEPYEFLREFL